MTSWQSSLYRRNTLYGISFSRSRGMATSLINRVAISVACRIRQNQIFLSSSSTFPLSSSSSEDSPSPSIEGIQITDNCVKRMKELHTSEASVEDKNLRLRVEAGGCSGFQYAFSLDDKTTPDDRIFEKDGVKLVVDNISYDFVKGATVDYAEELIRSAFQVTTNPSAVGGCSCKSSFMVK